MENEELKSMDELREIAKEAQEEQNQKETTSVVATNSQTKAITEISADDIKFTVDATKSLEKQAEDVVSAMATAKAAQDETVATALADQKAQELLAKGQAKVKEAEAIVVNAETEVQKSQRQLYEAVLNDFGIREHLPRWLMVILVVVLSPIYIIKSIVIGVPFGLAKTIVDNLDNVMCRYEMVNDEVKPKVKFAFIFLLVAAVVIAATLIVLRVFNII